MNEKRILSSLGQVDEKYIKEADPVNKIHTANRWKKWSVIAACFAFAVIIGIGVFYSGWFGAKTDRIILADGETITFVKTNMTASQSDLNVTIRELSAEEIEMLFGNLPITAHAYFDAEQHNIIGLGGTFEDMKMVVSTSGVRLLDTVIEGDEYTSTVDNTLIAAGYFVPKAGSQGGKTAIYYASFDIGENTIYLENAGLERDSEKIKQELADAIVQFIQNGAFDLSRIQE